MCKGRLLYGNVERVKLETNVKTFEELEITTAESMLWFFIHCLSFTLKIGLEASGQVVDPKNIFLDVILRRAVMPGVVETLLGLRSSPHRMHH